ncbi:MAG: ABC transporter permease [Acidobacteriaceae bacterium]|nr:ABC transporter permease [Acidobacteriaceae bacterium]
MGDFWQDVRYGLRMLASKPLFTAVAALSLALAIGLNTAIFTLVNTILLGSLPFPQPDRLVALFSIAPAHKDQLQGASVPDMLAWKAQAQSFEALGAAFNNELDLGAAENGMPAERIEGENVTPGLLRALGASPLMGRFFTESEDQVDHAAPVILISHRLWMRRFAGAPDILGRQILVNGQNTSIIGVMPSDFRFADENDDFVAPLPLNHFQVRSSARFLTVAARLKPGVSMQQAQTEMAALSLHLAQQNPVHDTQQGKPWMVRIQPIRQALFGYISRPLLLLQGAVAFVLLIACANVAALLLARSQSRQTEVAVRSALGAGRSRIIRQFLTESLLLSIIGGTIGVALASAGVHALVNMAPSWLPRLHAISINTPVLLFSALVSLLTGLLFGVIPAVQGSKATFVESLKDVTRGGTAGAARTRVRSVLVAGQIALALMLLIGSGLLIRSFLQLQGADLGCDPKGLLTFRYRFSEKQYGKPVGLYKGFPLWEISTVPRATLERVFERLQSVPGVGSVAGIIFPPMATQLPAKFTIEGKSIANADDLTANLYPITPNFFATMKIRVLSGRDFNNRDTAGSAWVAIINQTMAKRFFPGENPIGKRIRLDFSDEDKLREIVAVVKDIPATHPQTNQEPAMFIPFVQQATHITGPYTGLLLELAFVMRTQGDPMSALPAVRSAVEEIDRNRPLTDPRTEESYLADQAVYPRSYSMLLGLFAAVATALAAVGIYGVLAFTVEQRTREIGIRMALGAGAWDVLKLIGRQAIVVIAIGAAVGIAGAMALTRFISSELWEVKATDPETFIAVTALLVAVAIVACVLPTRRAVLVDPNHALRHE